MPTTKRAVAGRRQEVRRAAERQTAPRPPRELRGVLWVPLAFTLGLLLISFVPRVSDHATVWRSFMAASAGLLVWQALLYVRLRGSAISRALVLATPRPQHWIQALCQISVYAYWGWHWRPVYDYAWLLLAQLVFAYAFDILLQWSRREKYVLGFGPFPIIFSTNLFLWFRDDWFYLQFLLVAIGFMGKEFVRWHREGRSTHIFNPSAFSLGLFSLALIATNTTHLTWGPEIASTLTLAPHWYKFMFAVGLVVMYFFAITPVAVTAAATLFGLSALYSAGTGVPYFIDSEIPAAVFLGLHLLVTDPSTSPRTRLGRMMFGGLYGVGVFVLYWLLGALGAPTFYDKLLAVPLLNLSIQVIDRWVRSLQGSPLWTRWRLDWAPASSNLVHIGLWVTFFAAMTAMSRTDGRHTGDSMPFWEQACEEGRRNACQRLVQIQASYCGDNSGWACNELGRHYREGRIVAADEQRATGYFSRACDLRFQAGCINVLESGRVERGNPRVLDLRLLLREGGKNLMDMPEPQLYARACAHDWAFACQRLSGL